MLGRGKPVQQALVVWLTASRSYSQRSGLVLIAMSAIFMLAGSLLYRIGPEQWAVKAVFVTLFFCGNLALLLGAWFLVSAWLGGDHR